MRQSFGSKYAWLTRGAVETIGLCDEQKPSLCLPLEENVVDTVGAGDAFCAGFIVGRLDGVDLATALRMGNACGALAVAVSGDQAGLPDRAELARLLGGSPDTLR